MYAPVTTSVCGLPENRSFYDLPDTEISACVCSLESDMKVLCKSVCVYTCLKMGYKCVVEECVCAHECALGGQIINVLWGRGSASV